MKSDETDLKTVSLILNSREVTFPPDHFSYVDITADASAARGWILKNLKKRFYVDRTIILDNTNIKSATVVGFEDEKEMTLFLLSTKF